MDMRKMMAEAQKIQKKLEEFKKKEFFLLGAQGLVEITITGDRKVVSINTTKLIEESENDYEMINDMLKIALNEALKHIDKEEQKIAGNFK